MKKNVLFKVGTIFLLAILCITYFGCKSGKLKFDSNLDEIEETKYYFGQDFVVKINEENHKINTIETLINDKKVPNTPFKLDSSNSKLGLNYLTLNINYGENKNQTYDRDFTVYSNIKEKNGTYKVLQEYPHNEEIFTQGLEEEGGIIYEGAGQTGESKVIKYTLTNNKPIKETKNTDDVFGEGITVMNGKVYQLSWQNKKGFVYNASDLVLEKELPYPTDMEEGWGLCNDGTYLYATGVGDLSRIYVLTPDFKLVKILPVVGHDKLYYNVNELEYANGKIYANIWHENNIIVINPKTGQVEKTYDLNELAEKNQTGIEDVLNGIAHLSGNTFLITGKLWAKIFKVELE